MRPSDDDFLLTPEARLRELTGILAPVILRHLLRTVATPPAIAPENSGFARLEVPENTVLSVHTG
jgi:hypothetical protein